MDGTPGHFWTDPGKVGDLNQSDDGYVRLVDDEAFHIQTVRSRQLMESLKGVKGLVKQAPLPRPQSVFARTNVSRSLFFDIAGVSRDTAMLGPLASTQTIRTRGAVVNVPLEAIEGSDFLTVEMEIPEVTSWSGLEGVGESVEHFPDGRLKAWHGRAKHVDPIELVVRPGLTLTLSTTWSVRGPDDKRILSTPLVVGSISNRPRPWKDHLKALLAVQDLINLAYQGFVPAENATVQFKYRDDAQPLQTPVMWNSRLMTVPKGVSRPKKMSEFPLFFLDQIGGVRGLRNWIRLDRAYPRATGPIVNMCRYGTSGAEVRLVEIAMGLEYWTKINREEGRAWAKPRILKKKTFEPLPMAIGRFVGPAFANYVGDLLKWSDKFWAAYNSLKHSPNFEYDSSDISILADSGALLLQGALLNRIAQNKSLMIELCSSHRTQYLKAAVQDLLNR